MSRHAALLVFAPNPAGEQFLRALSEEEKLFVALACSPDQQQHLFELGVKNVIEVDGRAAINGFDVVSKSDHVRQFFGFREIPSKMPKRLSVGFAKTFSSTITTSNIWSKPYISDSEK